MKKPLGVSLILLGIYLLLRGQWKAGGIVDVIIPPTTANNVPVPEKCPSKIIPLHQLREVRQRGQGLALDSVSWYDRSTGQLLYTLSGNSTIFKTFGYPRALMYSGPDARGKCFYEPLW